MDLGEGWDGTGSSFRKKDEKLNKWELDICNL